MPDFPTPFFKTSRDTCYVPIGAKQYYHVPD
jgi:hypothetical protein